MTNPADQTRGCDLLLVEDSFDDAFFIQRAWKEFGAPCRLVHVSDGEKAREFLLGESSGRGANDPLPRLIVSDLKMPKLDGVELLRWVRSYAETAKIPFVILSSSPLEADLQASVAAGANGYFIKPRTLSGFLELLSDLSPFWT